MRAAVPEEIKRSCLRKVGESSVFARSEQLRRLLMWLGERAIEGVAPSEYEVGTGPLHRPANFDPQADSLVRKEMTRLRAKLRAYYELEGRRDAVQIFSGDAYRLSFHWSPPAAERDAAGTICVLVLPFRSTGLPADFTDDLYEHLLVRLSETGKIQLVAQTTARFYSGRSGDVRTFAVETGADFVVEGTVRLKTELIVTTLWVVDGRTGRTRSPCCLTGPDIEDVGLRAARCLVRSLRMVSESKARAAG
jgi:TolB-like protein